VFLIVIARMVSTNDQIQGHKV